MKILIIGAGKMGSFFCDVLSMKHDIAIYDTDPKRLLFTFNCRRFNNLEEIDEFAPDLVINAATVKYTIDAFNKVLPHLPEKCILSDIASVKTGLRSSMPTADILLYRPTRCLAPHLHRSATSATKTP